MPKKLQLYLKFKGTFLRITAFIKIMQKCIGIGASKNSKKKRFNIFWQLE